jgi:hypothetical protein
MSIVRSAVRSPVRSPVRSVLGGVNLLSQATAYLGGVAPYHWLDFITNRMLYAGADVGNVTQATGYSFTRASDGYYTNSDGTLTNFASGALRRGDRGVLIEGARTNLLTYSQQFDNAAWGAYGAKTITPNSTIAPDGTLTADTFTSTTAGNGISQANIAVSASTAYRFSLFVKAGAQGTRLSVNAPQYNAGNAYLGDLFSSSPNITAGTALANGWYRHDFGGTTEATTSKVDVRIVAFANNDAYIIWQADLQAGAFPSSPIVTVAAAATRAADVLTYTVNTTAQINAAVAGQPELLAPINFQSDWAFSGGPVTFDSASAYTAAATANVFRTLFTSGKVYQITINATFTSTALNLFNSNAGLNTIGALTSGVTSSFIFNAVDTRLNIRPTGGGAVTINSISVKEVPANSLTLYPIQLWSEFERAVDTGSFEELFNLDDGDSSDRAVLYVGTTDLASVDMRTASVSQGPATVAGTVALNTVTKLAGRFQTNDMRPARGGTLGTADTSCTLPAAPTRLVIGNAPSFGYIRRIAVIQGAGTDANLQAMTS